MRSLKFLSLAMLVSLLAACTPDPVEIDLKIKVTLDGQPIANATVTVDGVAEGETDRSGKFNKTMSKIPGKPVQLVVSKESGRVKTRNWEKSFTVAERKEDAGKATHKFDAALKRYLVFTVSHRGQPVADAVVSVGNKEVGRTDAQGIIEYNFGRWPRSGLDVTATGSGFGKTRISVRGGGRKGPHSGDKINLALYKEAVFAIEALTEHAGQSSPVKDVQVFVGSRKVGTTGKNGRVTYRHKGAYGAKTVVKLVANGYAPAVKTYALTLGGRHDIQRYFYSASPKPIKVGVIGFVANTAGENLSDVVSKMEEKFKKELFDEKAFVPVDKAILMKKMKLARMTSEKMQTNGWKKTSLYRSLDVLVVGSVSRGEGSSYVVEVKFYRADGSVAFSHAVVSGSAGWYRMGRAVSEIIKNVMATYPFEGTVIAREGEKAKINLGSRPFEVSRGDVFELKAARRDGNGRIVGFSDRGTMKVSSRSSDSSMLERAKMRNSTAINIGDRVVRETALDSKAADKVTIQVKGGVDGDETPLRGVSIYVDKRWVGSTNSRGEASIPVRLKRSHAVILYRHGYSQETTEIKPKKSGETFAYVLKSYRSYLTVESEPSGATVYLDDEKVGTTPITKPVQVTLGFHTVRVDKSGGYRAWEEVVEFNKKNEARTGASKIVLYPDYLKIAEKAEKSGDVDAAIKAYSSTTRKHPDYAEARHRLAQLYLDDKQDFDRAIAEFELVKDIPEVKELVLKQYAVVYTNLGHAYFAKAERLSRSNPKAAVQYYTKAVQALQKAKENVRFFPNDSYDEALHDTYYYYAMSYHNLYMMTKNSSILEQADNAWQDYFDFFPKGLEDKDDFVRMRDAARKMWNEIQEKL